MKNFIISLVLISFSPSVYLAAQQSGSMIVTISSIRNDLGSVAVAIHDHPDGFPGGPEHVILSKRVAIQNGIAQVKFEDVLFGEYAISVFHDENDNGEIDTNWLGIPKEGVGASNNAKGRMGPPKYEDAKFDFTEDGQKVEFGMDYY